MFFKYLHKNLKRNAFAAAACGRYSTKSAKTNLGIIGVPFSKGQPKAGVESAPDRLRANGLIDVITSASNGNLLINDYGNLKFSAEPDTIHNIPNMKNFGEVMSCNKSLIKKTHEILKKHDQILTIGGDHSIGFGSVAGHLLHEPNLALVWIDAHADLNLTTTSPSGNAHGMPVSLLINKLRRFWKTANLEEIAPVCLTPNQLVYIGLRSVDPYEAYIIEKLGIRAYAMDRIDQLGIQKVIEMALDDIKPQNKIHISFDIDSLDSRIAPSTGTPVEGGLTLREGVSIIEALRNTNRVEGFDLVEVNLDLGSKENADMTLSASFEIIKTLYGQKRYGDSTAIDYDIFKDNEM